MLVSPKPGRLISVVLAVLLVLARSPSVAASETGAAFPPDWLHWSPPPECPNQQYIEGRITEWLGGQLPASAQLEVQAELSWVDAARWEVHVRAVLNGREGRRHITVERCSDAADFVALAVVLAVNPDFAPKEIEGEVAAPTKAESAARAPAQEAAKPSQAAPVLPASHEKTPLFLAFGVRGELDLGTFPSARAGMAIDAAVGWPHWFLSLSGALYPEVEESLAGASGPIAFSRIVGRARGCYLFGKPSIRVGPCISAELGTMQAGQTSGHVDPPEASELWSAVAAGLEAQVAVLPWLSPFMALDATFPITRPRFVLDDGTLVHQPSVVALTGALGIRFFIQVR